MLVLARREGQKILIDGGRITIMVVEIRPNAVRLGIEAPKELVIDREEIDKKRNGQWR